MLSDKYLRVISNWSASTPLSNSTCESESKKAQLTNILLALNVRLQRTKLQCTRLPFST